MGEVIVTINNRSFKLGCDDGEEEHLKLLSEHIGKHVANLRHTIGKTGDDQLYLMAGLMVCDELWEAREMLLKTREILKQQSAQTNVQEMSLREQAAPVAVSTPVTQPAAKMPAPATTPTQAAQVPAEPVARPVAQPAVPSLPPAPPPLPVQKGGSKET